MRSLDMKLFTLIILAFSLTFLYMYAESYANTSFDSKEEEILAKILINEPKTNTTLPIKARYKSEPMEVTTAEQAKKLFAQQRHIDTLQDIDWTKQKLLVFYWQGSGGDALDLKQIRENDETVVKISVSSGLTRDFKKHMYAVLIQNGVKYKVDIKLLKR